MQKNNRKDPAVCGNIKQFPLLCESSRPSDLRRSIDNQFTGSEVAVTHVMGLLSCYTMYVHVSLSRFFDGTCWMHFQATEFNSVACRSSLHEVLRLYIQIVSTFQRTLTVTFSYLAFNHKQVFKRIL